VDHGLRARRLGPGGGEVDPLANRVETTFDANGNVTSTETGLSATVTTGDVTTYAYDAVDRLATVDPPGPGARTYSYDPDGRRTGFVNELGGTWAYAYDDPGPPGVSDGTGVPAERLQLAMTRRLAWCR
jgi:YD repeat-containing protein